MSRLWCKLRVETNSVGADVSIGPDSDQAAKATWQISGIVAADPPSLPVLNCPFLICSASSIPLIAMVADSKLLSPDALSNQDSIVDIAKAASVSIIAFQAELDYLLSDQQEHLRTYSERAFVHLQRSIAADNESKRKWTEAFDIGETACERLGSLHLLSHGMFAFKVNGEGARTDLVFPDKSVGSEAARFAEGLVLSCSWVRSSSMGVRSSMARPPRRFGF